MDPSFRIIILENLFLDRVKFIGLFIRAIDRVNFERVEIGWIGIGVLCRSARQSWSKRRYSYLVVEWKGINNLDRFLFESNLHAF